MRNLLILQTYSFLTVPSEPYGIWIDEFSKIIVILDSNLVVTIFNYDKPFSPFQITDTLDLIPLISESDIKLFELKENIKLIFYKSENNELIIFLKNGQIFKFNIETKEIQKISIINSTVLCVEISPSLEFITVITEDFKLYLLSNDLELLKSTDLDDKDLSDSSKDEKCLDASISWRGDNQFFSTLFTINGGRKCLIRDIKLNVFKSPARSDDKIVFSMSESPLNNLSNVVAWQPSGSLISYYQNDNGKKKIVFSEKNGLKHGEFKIDEKFGDVLLMKWNLDLPMICSVHTLNENQQVLNIYIRSNYEWNLKFSKIVDKIKTIKFSDSQSLRLFTLSEKGDFTTYDFKLEYQNSLSNYNFKNDNGTVSFYADQCIKFSPLAICNIPPPMCFHKIPLSSSPPHNFFWYKNLLFISGLNTLSLVLNDVSSNSYNTVLSIQNEIFDNDIKQIFVMNNGINYYIFAVKSLYDSEKDLLVRLKCDIELGKGKESLTILSSESIRIDRVSGIFNSLNSDEIYERKYYEKKGILINNFNPSLKKNDLSLNALSQFGNNIYSQIEEDEKGDCLHYFYIILSQNKVNNFYKLLINPESFSTRSLVSLDICSHFDIVKSKSIIENDTEKIIYLTRNNRLYINDHLFSLDITSFEIFKNFLFLTQTTNNPYNYLHTIDINHGFSFNPNKKSDPYLILNEEGFNVRRLERGAFIVTVTKINVVIQTPRGNLETIYPRILVLNEIIELIQERAYYEAFELVRKHKINVNFIYDVDPEGFFKHSAEFVHKIKKVDYLNLFLNGLENKFSEEILKISPESNQKDALKKLYIDNKVNIICDEMHKEISKINQDNTYLTSIIHTLTKKSPPEYLKALKLIQNLKLDPQNVHSSEKTLEYLCWVVNADILFDFALKTYDFELVIMVAKHTQKDPKEYLPYLKALQEKEEILMKYQINIDLKNYEDALIELSKGDEKYFELAIELIEKHKLYEKGISLFSKTNPKLVLKIWGIYGKNLESNAKFQEAGNAYLLAEMLENSLQNFIKSGSFSDILVLIKRLNLDFDRKRKIFSDIIENSPIKELELLFSYLRSDSNFALFSLLKGNLIRMLLKSKKYQLAFNLLQENLSPDLQAIFNEELQLSATLKSSDLSKNKQFFDEKYARLLKVQYEKKTMPQLNNIENNNFEESLSDTGSKNSKKSKKSSSSKMSMKTKNKIRLKKIKEGSPLEEEYLLVVLNDLKINQDEINNTKELITVLKYGGFSEVSNELNEIIDDYVKIVNNLTLYSNAQLDFISTHQEVRDLFPNHFGGKIQGLTKQKLIEKD